ncbi:MAG: hypothetical protein L0J58_10540, partial [Micrococcaceae bacterium]|nr:hypothetical protein [Micrococcaceae bacterium]
GKLPARAVLYMIFGGPRRCRWGAGAPAAPPVPGAAVVETEAELGELLLGIVADAHERGLDAERSLRTAVARYMTAAQPTSSSTPGTG